MSVSPPSSAARNSPSGLSARRIWTSAPGRSLTNCSASAETTRSSVAGRHATALRRRTRSASTAAALCPTPPMRAATHRPACRYRRRARTCAAPPTAARQARPRRARAGTSRRPALCARCRRAAAARGRRWLRARGHLLAFKHGRARLPPAKTKARRAWRNGAASSRPRSGFALDVALPPLCPSCREPVGDGAGCAPTAGRSSR